MLLFCLVPVLPMCERQRVLQPISHAFSLATAAQTFLGDLTPTLTVGVEPRLLVTAQGCKIPWTI